MALNFSQRPIFAGEENWSGAGDGFRWHDAENCFDYGCDRGSATQDCVSNDILDRLPSDPFGMDMSTTFTAAFTEMYGGYRMDEVAASDNNYRLFAMNFFSNNFNNGISFPGFPTGGNMHVEEKNEGKRLHKMSIGECSSRESCDSVFQSACDVDDMLSFDCDFEDEMGDTAGENCLGEDELGPHPALNFALCYLGLADLLAVERVCKSLHSTVQGDPLLWRSIHLDQPLNERIADDVLFQLTNRSQGKLQCLRLVECTRITDDGLRRVLEANPTLIKLSVPGCTRLTIDGIVGILKAFRSMGTQGVRHLHIGGLYGVTQQHYEEILLLLGTDSQMLQHSHKPHFYCRGNLYLSCDDRRAIDIEVCPRCQNLRLVYDCPAEGCQGVGNATQACRACTLCIPRCSQCGRCINDSEYEETFCLELLCSMCSKQLLKCSEMMERKFGPTKSVVLPEEI
ncbi:hypothetical protein Lal_00029740 [Lupinus albus]|uniref:Putative F-box domain, leucine-rich repeat domain, L domain-containing protein n=1 Tax=Lupinus albus TaxID=3870 RepID=A0A6A5MZU0_LUPAL|nr:putative F-box domain, leucine-rich repeat domain, L domain-containing protein [Lupinus albus]KAF1876392.1 hypothetical protein Lal_00029740 [Lupinus albus]